MNSAEFQKTKNELAQLILNIKSEELIEKVRNFLSTSQVDFWDELSEDQKADIQKGRNDIKEGRTISLDELIKKVS